MKKHKLASLFPEITGQDFDALVADIKANGLRQPITTLSGAILDGVNRYAACLEAGVKPLNQEFEGKDPLAFVISQNMARRHLTDDQRAAIAADIARAKPGNPTNLAPLKSEPTVDEAAESLKVSPRKVQKAKALKKESPAAFKKVKAGKMSLNKAHEENHPRKPLARGGLAAEAIMAKQDAAQRPAALKGIDMSKVDPVDSLPNPVLPPCQIPPADPSEPVKNPDDIEPATSPRSILLPVKMTPASWGKIMGRLKPIADEAAGENQKEREKYGRSTSALASHQMNPVNKSTDAYY